MARGPGDVGNLEEYNRKRDFAITPEPAGREAASESGRMYLIQKHEASRLHYDLRLELDGVLKSWAVPKGPSLDPAQKHLAMHVEDHPIEYGSFEGVIPEGEYGGGTVMLWDRGTWEPIGDPEEGYRKGRLKFRLHGERLTGRWMLARWDAKRDEGRSWLLFKERDDAARPAEEGEVTALETTSVASGRTMEEIAADRERVWTSEGEVTPPRQRFELDVDELPGARKAALPGRLAPQLATLVARAPEGDDWLHEVKHDGYRILAVRDHDAVRLWSRNGIDWTARLAAVAAAVRGLPVDAAVLDGEVVALGPDGASDFNLLQNALKGGGSELLYYVFDAPYLAGHDLRRVGLEARKGQLKRLLESAGSGRLRYSDHIRGDGAAVLAHACELSLEGIVSKRADARYESRRTTSWVKVKCVQRQELVIGGWSEPKGSRNGLGALHLGYWQDGRLRHAGKVGTGFSERTITALRPRLDELARATPPFENPPRGAAARGVHWVEPELVCEVEFLEWTRDGQLRHPSFQGLREDRDPREVMRERPAGESAASSRRRGETKRTEPAGRADAKRPEPAAGTRRRSSALEISGVRFTNPDKVLYPEMGVTKLEIARYWEAVAERALPHIVGRPLSIVRCPQGHEKFCFFQKHLGESPPERHLEGVQVMTSDAEETYIVAPDLAGVIALVQLGALELHPWGATTADLEHPDRLVFDLDPGPGVGWPAVVAAARAVRERLNEASLESWVKTSGGKGLHVVVPLRPKLGWEEARAFTEAVARAIARDDPKRYTASMSKARREGRIFIDYLRNTRNATAVGAYSTRARPGAPVSAPIAWEELDDLPGAFAFTVRSLPGRLEALRTDPWAGLLRSRQTITQAARRRVGLPEPGR